MNKTLGQQLITIGFLKKASKYCSSVPMKKIISKLSVKLSFNLISVNIIYFYSIDKIFMTHIKFDLFILIYDITIIYLFQFTSSEYYVHVFS